MSMPVLEQTTGMAAVCEELGLELYAGHSSIVQHRGVAFCQVRCNIVRNGTAILSVTQRLARARWVSELRQLPDRLPAIMLELTAAYIQSIRPDLTYARWCEETGHDLGGPEDRRLYDQLHRDGKQMQNTFTPAELEQLQTACLL
jgi:hypothetical protein